MKRKFARLLLGFALLSSSSALAETLVVKPEQAQEHVGQMVTVDGVVSEVHHAASGKVIFIDIGGRYPNNAFAAVIFKEDFDKFPDVDALAGKTVDITGAIKLYKDRPEIILNDPRQIKVK
jgi:exonuclease VII large subunit